LTGVSGSSGIFFRMFSRFLSRRGIGASFQAGALDDLLAEVRKRMQDSNRRTTAGQR
jgi:hypothetical protein